MFRKHLTVWTFAAGAVLATSLAFVNRPLDAQDKKASTDKKPESAAGGSSQFADKVLLVQKKSDGSPQVFDLPQFQAGLQGYVLENPTVVEIAGVKFLAGHGIERVDGKPVGPRLLLALESIGSLQEFESVKAFQEFEEQQTEKIQLRMQGVFGNMGVVLPAPVAVEAEAAPEQ